VEHIAAIIWSLYIWICFFIFVWKIYAF